METRDATRKPAFQKLLQAHSGKEGWLPGSTVTDFYIPNKVSETVMSMEEKKTRKESSWRNKALESWKKPCEVMISSFLSSNIGRQ